MDNCATPEALTYETFMDAFKELNYPGYGRLKEAANKFNPMERMFRLKAMIDMNNCTPAYKKAGTRLLEDLQNG